MKKYLCYSRDIKLIGRTDIKKNEDMIKDLKRQGKRKLATFDGVKFDLKNALELMFKAFHEANEMYEKEIIQTPPLARARGFEASLLNSKMIQCIQKYFPENCRFGRYKRFILRVNGYIILFKKLDKKNRPMNIKTKLVNAISNQLTLSLFNDTTYVQEPILYFGYNKDKIGNISEPKLVYLDEDRIKWEITANDIIATNISDNSVVEMQRKTQTATPILKKGKVNKRKIN
jgi:hypothetical protein